ncbi:MAG: DUF1080 domain-containing protein [Saprospiraceae bacterium]|nr:DUF1080 domain-containing protein [Saprospiraceae bacterium]
MKLIFSVLLSVCGLICAEAQPLKQLFNTKNLDGWTVVGTEKWYVENGELVCASGPDKGYGYLATQESFKNFDLRLEFKQEADGNSGVFFHSSFEGTRVTGWQAEVAPAGHSTGGIYESYKRGWLIKPTGGKDTKYLKADDWNTMRILVKNNKVTTWLNGHKMITLKDDMIGSRTGQLALQIHDGGGIKVRWRNMFVKVLK